MKEQFKVAKSAKAKANLQEAKNEEKAESKRAQAVATAARKAAKKEEGMVIKKADRSSANESMVSLIVDSMQREKDDAEKLKKQDMFFARRKDDKVDKKGDKKEDKQSRGQMKDLSEMPREAPVTQGPDELGESNNLRIRILSMRLFPNLYNSEYMKRSA